MYAKEIDKLKECATEMAHVMGMDKLSSKETSELYNYLIALPQNEGGKEILGCFELGMVTKTEVIHFLQSHTYTTILRKNSWPKISDNIFEDSDIFKKFEVAIFTTLK